MLTATRSKRRRYAKRDTVDKNDNKLAYQRVVYLPYDMAIYYSAMQNFRIDLAKGIHPDMTVWTELRGDYLHEAISVLKDDGSNFFPGDNGEPWIHSKDMHKATPTTEASVRAMYLQEIADHLFSTDDEELLKREDLLPSPEKCNDTTLMLSLMNCRRLLTKMH